MDHKDSNRMNASLDNLEWIPHDVNVRRAYERGNHDGRATGEKNCKSKLNKELVMHCLKVWSIVFIYDKIILLKIQMKRVNATKELLSIEEQIEHMKKKGITFIEISEEDAKEFLKNNNYYMKCASYRANYEKCDLGKRKGQYKKLDFAYLKELSTIDMHLRYLIIEMCLDIEHALKVKLINEVTNNEREDGYNIVRRFLADDDRFRILKSIKGHKSGEYCKDLISKYYPYFPVWVFVELISFGDLIYFCSFYEKEYGVQIVNNKFMNIVRDLRNAAAHSNCILNKITERIDETKQIDSELSNFIKSMHNISKTSRVNNLNYKFANNFITLLFVYNSLMAVGARKKRYKEIQDFMDNRMIRNSDFFSSNTKIVGAYKFHKKVVDNLVNDTYNV